MDNLRREAVTTRSGARRTMAQAFALEANTAQYVMRLGLNYPALLREPRGRGEPVMVLPGYSASDRSTVSLRRYLRQLGYTVQGWGLGTNSGHVAGHVRDLLPDIAALHAEHGRKVSLVGWSMGGNIAREIARLHPEWISQVVTMGSPISGGPKYTAMAGRLAAEGVNLDQIERELHWRQRNSAPLQVPVTAIFSRRDGIVAWQACIDHFNQHVEHVEVRSSHFGLGFDPAVYRIIARRLHTPESS